MTTPGEQYKKVQGFEMYRDNSWGAVQDHAFGSKDLAGIIRAECDVVTPVSIPSEPSGFSSRLSSSIDDSHELAFFGIDDKHGIHVVTEDSIPIESSRLGSRISSLDGDLFEHDAWNHA
jgi:hypothetical protein